METALQIIWGIGLLGALVLTAVLLKQVSLLLRVLRQIHRLGVYTRDAADGLAARIEAAEALRDAGGPAAQFAAAAEELREECASIHRRLRMHVERSA